MRDLTLELKELAERLQEIAQCHLDVEVASIADLAAEYANAPFEFGSRRREEIKRAFMKINVIVRFQAIKSEEDRLDIQLKKLFLLSAFYLVSCTDIVKGCLRPDSTDERRCRVPLQHGDYARFDAHALRFNMSIHTIDQFCEDQCVAAL
jgi:hypothetical protein